MTNPKIDKKGAQYWYNENEQLHREDGPALIYSDGTELWYKNGKKHREDGPAVFFSDGTQRWYQNNKLHREDGPAVIWTDGTQFWYKNGEYHRIDGPAIINKKRTYGRYYLYGEKYLKKDFQKHPDVITYQKLKELL